MVASWQTLATPDGNGPRGRLSAGQGVLGESTKGDSSCSELHRLRSRGRAQPSSQAASALWMGQTWAAASFALSRVRISRASKPTRTGASDLQDPTGCQSPSLRHPAGVTLRRPRRPPRRPPPLRRPLPRPRPLRCRPVTRPACQRRPCYAGTRQRSSSGSTAGLDRPPYSSRPAPTQAGRSAGGQRLARWLVLPPICGRIPLAAPEPGPKPFAPRPRSGRP